MSQKTHLAAVFDCRTIIVGYYNVIIIIIVIIQLACAYNEDDLYHTGRIDLPGMHKHIEGQTVDYIKIESENQKSGLIILLVLFHSVCPYKYYCLKCFTELQTLFIYLFKLVFFLLSNFKEPTKQKKVTKNPPSCSLELLQLAMIIIKYYYYTTCTYMCIQYRRPFPYRSDRSALYGKGRLYCMRVHRIYTWLLDSRKAWAANIAIEWLPCTSI